MKTYLSDNLIIPEDVLSIYTTNSQAIQINRIIKMYSDKNCTITDATAGIGGNSIFFINDFKSVNLIEKDNYYFNILKKNTKCPNTTYNCSYIYIRFMLKQDIIYFDPPWGGNDYKSKKRIDLYLDNINVLDIIDELYCYTKIIALKVPNNFNTIRINDNFWHYKIYNITKSKKCIYKLIIFHKPI